MLRRGASTRLFLDCGLCTGPPAPTHGDLLLCCGLRYRMQLRQYGGMVCAHACRRACCMQAMYGIALLGPRPLTGRRLHAPIHPAAARTARRGACWHCPFIKGDDTPSLVTVAACPCPPIDERAGVSAGTATHVWCWVAGKIVLVDASR